MDTLTPTSYTFLRTQKSFFNKQNEDFIIFFDFLIRSIMNFYEGFKENELSDVKIEEILDKMKVYDFHGIYARDELKKEDMEKGFYIFNLG